MLSFKSSSGWVASHLLQWCPFLAEVSKCESAWAWILVSFDLACDCCIDMFLDEGLELNPSESMCSFQLLHVGQLFPSSKDRRLACTASERDERDKRHAAKQLELRSVRSIPQHSGGARFKHLDSHGFASAC